MFNGKSILVTGGSGSFGNAFVRRVLDKSAPERLIIFSRDELKQYEMTDALRSYDNSHCLRFFIGDVRDASRLEMALGNVDYVVHAAALKQVPTAEYNPFECVHTNVLGAENVVRAALRCGVKHVIALSTDKAASAVNLYGATKLASDKIFVAANRLVGNHDVRFSVVRYGNVLGSRGSVLPLFTRLIAQGAKKLPITDPRMTRFWITLEQGVDFVVSCFSMMRGGEIFVPRIPSMRIVDLARTLGPNLEHEIIGVRPGEKLHEVMITEEDSRQTIELADRYIMRPPWKSWPIEELRKQGAREVPENFRFGSDNNTEWLDAAALTKLLGEKLPR
ncbi:MAG: UDP-N-acetylglucosamine 4,6-dehydratase (inverting) [Pseudorhodoplanes sp.]|nr:UDP-N-acetylglucosamine 4,6-dehydratase (inverting) [Pseudorhodoplanes sp.]